MVIHPTQITALMVAVSLFSGCAHTPKKWAPPDAQSDQAWCDRYDNFGNGHGVGPASGPFEHDLGTIRGGICPSTEPIHHTIAEICGAYLALDPSATVIIGDVVIGGVAERFRVTWDIEDGVCVVRTMRNIPRLYGAQKMGPLRFRH